VIAIVFFDPDSSMRERYSWQTEHHIALAGTSVGQPLEDC